MSSERKCLGRLFETFPNRIPRQILHVLARVCYHTNWKCRPKWPIIVTAVPKMKDFLGHRQSCTYTVKYPNTVQDDWPFCKPFLMRFLIPLCSSWQYVNLLRSSRGPPAVSEPFCSVCAVSSWSASLKKIVLFVSVQRAVESVHGPESWRHRMDERRRPQPHQL